MNDICKILGKNFARLRQEQQHSQKQIAIKSGMSSGYISSFENGRQNPTIKTIKKLAKALEVDYFKLFD